MDDADSNFVYMQQRYYDPEVGRFISRDPAGYTAGDKFGLNPYVYARNNHDPKWKDRDPKPTRQEVLDDYNSDTRLRCVSCNRSDNK